MAARHGFLMSRAPLGRGEIWRAGPIRLTSAARTLVDCAREWPLEDAVVAMDAGLLAERTTTDELRRTAAAVHGWPGASRAVRAAALADGRAESPLETRGRLRMLGAGLPPPELQVEIKDGGRLVGVVDAWFDEAAVAVEFDGQVKYTDPWRGRSPERVLWDEKRREDELRSLDIRVVRVVDADIDSGLGARGEPAERLCCECPARGPSLHDGGTCARTPPHRMTEAAVQPREPGCTAALADAWRLSRAAGEASGRASGYR